MTKSILLAGFGGQGILFAGKQLASCGMAKGMNITWLPSYGPESRGGTCNCSVILSDEEIGSPLVSRPDYLVAFNVPSFVKFENAVKPFGTIFADSTLVNKISDRDDISVYYVPASGIAAKNDLMGFANVIMLGKIVAVTKLFTHDEFIEHMIAGIPESKSAMIDKNRRAFALGFSFK
ncbi:MAG: 2-oxoacid:acceptor oxidoreductase family protein [Eubacteriales bacterium]|jgi:2-oxoglutarate ferredoxin oxidoreductase subunit gamma|nr:2-oxoacid:acceptor oxidoreductase family protein [Eubacteriales bacterium]